MLNKLCCHKSTYGCLVLKFFQFLIFVDGFILAKTSVLIKSLLKTKNENENEIGTITAIVRKYRQVILHLI